MKPKNFLRCTESEGKIGIYVGENSWSCRKVELVTHKFVSSLDYSKHPPPSNPAKVPPLGEWELTFVIDTGTVFFPEGTIFETSAMIRDWIYTGDLVTICCGPYDHSRTGYLLAGNKDIKVQPLPVDDIRFRGIDMPRMILSRGFVESRGRPDDQ